MPYISEFYGITIRMYYDEHNPPHFHAYYQGKRGTFDLKGQFLKGSLNNKTALALIKQWAKEKNFELVENWQHIEEGILLNKIKPLD